MPELPDLEIYLEALRPRLLGQRLVGVRLASPFLLRSVRPSLTDVAGKPVTELQRLGKRLVFRLEGDFFLVLHLMIAGRLAWKDLEGGERPKIPARIGLAAFDFEVGTLLLREAGAKKRASLYVVAGETALAEHDPGGLEVLSASFPTFATTLRRENRTLKRALTDPHILAGIGNAYSDEILHQVRLSPFLQTGKANDATLETLFRACQEVLIEWTDRLRTDLAASKSGFPDKVTAFRPEMAVHGRHRQPCPVCATPVQRIVYAANEANYCPTCQTDGKLLADRALSQLLKSDWPKTWEELEKRRGG